MAGPDFARLRRTEFGRLDEQGSAYLDYTGAALYPASLVRRDGERLAGGIFGNPHSESASSRASTGAVERARRQTLRLLDADPAIYDVVFTANTSGALRLVAEGFPFRAGSRLLLTADNHNSVNGLWVAARRRRATVECVPLGRELRACSPRRWLTAASAPSLFAYPAQSNFSGVRHPLAWVREAQRRGYRVLLDAAAYVPAMALSLRDVPADFVALSFYKLFGYPTGVGALVARRDALAVLRRQYFAGGTVEFASVQNRMVRRKPGGDAFEDGTPHFLGMDAVCDGLEWLHRLGMPAVARHTGRLTASLLDRMRSLGARVTVYGPGTLEQRGGVVTFNLRRGGGVLPYEAVEAAARDAGIAVRGGCFCNPGAAEHAFAIPARAARACLRGEFSIPRFRSCLGVRAVGAIRASVGVATTVGDLDRLHDLAAVLTA